ncbi:hypothetical protein DN619_35245, partial [Klebsiella michiganensis]
MMVVILTPVDGIIRWLPRGFSCSRSPGRTFYTHISDQYAPFSAKVVNVGIRDSTYVLDGLLYHES